MALVLPGEDPIVDAVRQLRLHGDESRAREFAHGAQANAPDETRHHIDELLAQPREEIESPAASPTASEDGDELDAFYWNHKIELDYTYCIITGCDPNIVGTVMFEYIQSLYFAPDVLLMGGFRVMEGPDVKMAEWRCTTYNEALVDWPVHSWGEACATQYDYSSIVTIIKDMLWEYPLTLNDKYHTEFAHAWLVRDDISKSVLTYVINSPTWQVRKWDGNRIEGRYLVPEEGE